MRVYILSLWLVLSRLVFGDGSACACFNGRLKVGTLIGIVILHAVV